MDTQPRTPAHDSLAWHIARSSVATLIMLAAFVAAPTVAEFFPSMDRHKGALLAAQWGIAAVALVAGVIAIRGWLGLIFSHVDQQAAVVLRNVGSWALYACLVLGLLTALGVNLSGLLVGGAIVGVIVGAAAQSSLGNFFAGILLMIARPYQVGVTLRLRTTIAGMLELEGAVVDMNAFFTTLRTARGELLRLPNQVVMNSAMTVGKPPLQATMQLTVPAAVSLDDLRSRVQGRLNDPGAEVLVMPISLTSATETAAATVLCQIDVRSRQPLDEGALSAVTAALALQRPS